MRDKLSDKKDKNLYRAVWAPWHVPYRLPAYNTRWSMMSMADAFPDAPEAEVIQSEPDLPAGTLENGSVGLRMERMGEIEWALNLFHGQDPRPVFKAATLRITQSQGKFRIDPGVVPSFHEITSIGMDGAAVKGSWSLRGEAAYTIGRAFNSRQELWGYPESAVSGDTSLSSIEVERDTLDYGIAADRRLFEDALLTLQAQQTLILNRPDALYDRAVKTLLWVNLKVNWMNQKIETNINLAANPEHGATLFRSSLHYVFNDSWKVSVTGLWLEGPPQSIFGKYAKNDQIEMGVTFLW